MPPEGVQLSYCAGLDQVVGRVTEQKDDRTPVAVSAGDHEVEDIVSDSGVCQCHGRPFGREDLECHDPKPAASGSLQFGCPQGKSPG